MEKRNYRDKCEASFQCSELQSLSCVDNLCIEILRRIKSKLILFKINF